jgi:hypothetical protein
MKKKVRVEEPIRLRLHVGRSGEIQLGAVERHLTPVDLLTWCSGNFKLRVARYSGVIMQ